MKRLYEGTILGIALVGIILSGSDAEAGIWPLNVLAGAALLAMAGLLAISRPAPRR